MTTQLDSFIGLGKETTYGTPVTPISFVTFTEETIELKLDVTDAAGMRPGRRTTLNTQRVINKIEVTGDLTVEATPAEIGVQLGAFMGAGTSTLVAGGMYQHNFTMAADYLPSYTLQKGIPPLGGGTQVPFTFVGMQCSALELSASAGAIPTIKTTWQGQNIVTGGGTLATPVYPAINEEFTYTGGSITVGGTIVQPTTTTVASGGTSVATVTDADIKLDNALDSGGYTLGGGGASTRPAAALLAKLTGTLTAEFRDSVFWAAYTGQQRLAVVLNFTGSIPTGETVANQLQVIIPVIVLEGETPKVKAGDIVTQSISFTILQDLTDGLPPILFVLRNKVSSF